MNIIEDNLSGPEIAALLGEHLDGMAEHSPPESIHALDLAALKVPEITFWTAWEGSALLGCGALKQLDITHGEIKSMRTAAAHLGRGVASRLLTHIVEESIRRSYRRLSLETGSGDGFVAAHRLYLKFGFTYCGPFGGYRDDPFSRFMTRELNKEPTAR